IIHKNFFNEGPMTAEKAADMWRKRMVFCDRAIVGESARWGDNRETVPNARSEWVSVQETKLSTFFPRRSDDFVAIMKTRGLYPNVPAPSFKVNGAPQHGGHIDSADSLFVSAGAATIYYTVDGNDPRLPGGAINTASATEYSTPFSLDHSTHVKARAYSGGVWSALNEAVFAVGPVAASLRINEIHYHPAETGDPNDPNEEFVELWNIGTVPINLNLVRFTNGIDFTFGDIELGPGEFVIVVRHMEVFLREYAGFTGIIAGQYSGRLNNGGERVELQDALGQTIQTFKYKDGWYDITDGLGFSLTVLDPGDNKVYRPDLGLISHWKLDETAGATAVDSIGGHDGTLHGDAAWADGRIGGALSLDGDGDYVSLSSHPTLEGEQMTVEAWVNLSGSGGINDPIVMQHTALNEGYRFNVVSNKPTFAIIVQGRGDVVLTASLDSISKHEWHHLAGTNDGSDLKLYVDGELKGSVSSAGYTGFANEAYIGYDYSSSAYWHGMIDDVRIYNRALGEHEFAGVTDPLDRWDAKSSWRASAFAGGSPGWDDSIIMPAPGGVVINEILAHSHGAEPDWIELYNTTDKSVQIGGWYLSDSRFNLRKYRIAPNTRIGAHDYKVFYEDLHFGDASTDPGKLEGFGFSENGDEAYLTSAHTDILTGYRESESFGASYTGISFGRYFKSSTGNFNFVPMDFNTPGWGNAYPKVGPIVISEIMYNPDWPIGGTYGNDRYEYIELENITDAPVSLWRADKALPWKFKDGVDYTFPGWPDYVTIQPHDHIVVVRDVNAFTERYPSVPEAKIFGPYDGQLDNGGEQLELEMPGDIDKFGRQHYIRIDRVTYSDGDHSSDVPGGVDLWPVEADGGGMSLNRIDTSLYGNDPNNWTAQTPSPGD
ncbi:MAG: lamin tail domain-containing protein, partial [Planctomycetota bacterium]